MNSKQSSDGSPSRGKVIAVVGGGLALVAIFIGVILFISGKLLKNENQTAAAGKTEDDLPPPQVVSSTDQLSKIEYRPLPDLKASASARAALAYNWTKAKSTTYRFDYSMKSSRENFTIKGTNRLTASRTRPDRIMDSEEMAESGTGTCFFVHPDGLAVTCAHVVEGSQSIEVRYENNWVKANVIALDAQNDLALIKIQKDEVPVLPIAQSDDLELAESIHIIGYPIQDILGSSVKFNSGAITGFKKDNNASEMLFDANINPGNSGGPVIDQSGNVVGVASAMLQGEGLNSVAMAVMSNRVFDLLRKNKIQLPVSEIDNPVNRNSELAKKSTPAVCLVRTKGRTGLQVVDHYTRVNIGNGIDNTVMHGQMVVDSAGEVLSFSEDSGGAISLFLLAPAKVGLEKRNLYDGEKWQHRSAKLIAMPQTETIQVPSITDYGMRGRFRFRGPIGSPFSRPQTKTSVVMVLGLETVNYTKESEDNQFVTYKVIKTIQSLHAVLLNTPHFPLTLRWRMSWF